MASAYMTSPTLKANRIVKDAVISNQIDSPKATSLNRNSFLNDKSFMDKITEKIKVRMEREF